MTFTRNEKTFWVLEYARAQSNKSMQGAFSRKFNKNAPTGKQIWAWHKKFKEEDCLCRAKGSGRPPVSEDIVNQVRETFAQSPRKSVRRASLETQTSRTTLWRVVRKCLRMTPYKLQLIQALKTDDREKCKQFCVTMQEKLEDEEFEKHLVFSGGHISY